jgi:uncharacterized protein (TIGR03086 family)
VVLHGSSSASDARQPSPGVCRTLDSVFPDVLARYRLASAGFERVLRCVDPSQWAAPTPCSAWDVRALVNHMARGNLNYALLARGGSAAVFVRRRDGDALGVAPLAAYLRSVAECADAFSAPGVLSLVLDYPLGRAPGDQLLAVRTADSLIHTWDLAQATGFGGAEVLDAGLVSWMLGSLDEIYAGLDGVSAFFGPAVPPATATATPAELLLSRMGRMP